MAGREGEGQIMEVLLDMLSILVFFSKSNGKL